MVWTGRTTRYVLKELFTPTLLGLLLFTFVLLMNHFFLVAEQALSRNLGAALTFRLFAVGIPKLLVMSIPMAVLLGTLIGLGRLSADLEWVALQAAGQGPGVILKPVVLHGLMGAAACFLIYTVVVPQTHFAVRSLRGEILFASNVAADLKPRVFHDLPDDAVIHVDDIRPGTEGRLESVLLIQPDPEREGTTQLVVARYGDVYPAPDGTGALLVDFYEGEVHYFRSDQPDKYQFATFDSLQGKRLEAPRFLKTLMTPPEKVAQDFTMGELVREIREARTEREELFQSSGNVSEGRLRISDTRIALATVELHRRIALPLACVCFTLLAVPLGISTARTGKGAAFALSIVVILVYRIVFVAATKQAVTGRIPADLGPWIANVAILVWAAIAYWRMRRRTVAGMAPILGLLIALWRSARIVLPAAERRETSAEDDESTSDLAALGGSTRRFVGRLDGYVALAFLRVFALALLSIYLIYAVFEGQELIDRALRTNQPLGLVAKYLQYFLPGVLHVVLPISCLIGAVVSVTLLSRTSELVAIRAAGVSLRRVTAPILLLSLLFSFVAFLVQDRIAPATNRIAAETKDRIRRVAPRTRGLPATGSWRFGSDGGTLYHFHLHDADRDEYQGLSVFTLDRRAPRILDHRFTERARPAGAEWELGPGWYRTFDALVDDPGRAPAADIQSTLTRYGEPYRMALTIPHDIVGERRWLTRASDELPDQMSVAELAEQIDTLRNSGYDITKPRVAYHRKYAQPLAPVVMVLLGLPFAFRVGRRGSLYGIGVALLLVLVYWATFAVFNALGLETLLPPALAAWAPNAFYALLGTYLLLYVRT